MIRQAAACLLVLTMLAGCNKPGSTGCTTCIPGVPDQYQSLYTQLQANVTALDAQSASEGLAPSATGNLVTAAALSPADGNRGKALLLPTTLPLIHTELDRFQSLGINGAMLEVGYPLLLPSFPDSSSYEDFYTKVAADVHGRGMTLAVELNPVFPDPQISSVHPDYSALTIDSYAAQQRQEAQIVIDTVHPEFLDVLDEPSTFSANLGLHFDTPAGIDHVLGIELDGLQRGRTKVGAGIVDFEDPSLETAIAGVSGLDYLSVHVYPTGPDQISILNDCVKIAATAKLPLVMDETWLSKVNVAGKATKGQSVLETRLKTYSFWQAPDSAFMAAITRYARAHGLALVSPFSSDQFFAYLDWTSSLETDDLSAVRARESSLEQVNISEGNFMSTALAYKRAIAGQY